MADDDPPKVDLVEVRERLRKAVEELQAAHPSRGRHNDYSLRSLERRMNPELKGSSGQLSRFFDGGQDGIAFERLAVIAKMLGVRLEWVAWGKGPMWETGPEAFYERSAKENRYTAMPYVLALARHDEVEEEFLEHYLATYSHDGQPSGAGLYKDLMAAYGVWKVENRGAKRKVAAVTRKPPKK